MRFHVLASLVLPFVSCAFAIDQIPLGAETTMPPETYTPQTNTEPTLADVLTIESSASIFFSYAREVQLSESFADAAGAPMTLLVPTNKAVMALARKPHQGPAPPEDTGVIISEEELDARSKQNVERWVSAHIIPTYPMALSPGTVPTLLDGRSVRVRAAAAAAGQPEAPEWARVVLDDGIHIIAAKQAANGVVYVIDDTVKLA